MRVNRMIVALLAVLGGASVTAGPAAALEPGVFVDPTSPAGKEYSFPLDVQRGAAIGSDAPQGTTPPLFGVGITARRSAGGRRGGRSNGSGNLPAGTRRTSGANGSKPATKRGSALRARSAKRATREAAALQSLSRPGSTWSQVALTGMAVVLGGLLVGAAAAMVARRRT